jgi:hypothetical protein
VKNRSEQDSHKLGLANSVDSEFVSIYSTNPQKCATARAENQAGASVSVALSD